MAIKLRPKNIDLLSIKQLEQELLNLGNEVDHINVAFEENTLEDAGVVYVRRSRWLNTILVELADLYYKVDEQTQKLMGLLYIANASFEEVSESTERSVKYIRKIHKLIVTAMAEKLGLITVGESKLKETSRYLTVETRKKVNERYNNKCAVCYSEEDLHYHHIEYFSEGGSNEVDNLMLLCASCHAEEHKGEKAYYVLRAIVRE